MSGSGSRPVLEINRTMLRNGIGLMGVGGLLWFTGASMTTVALGQAARKYVQQLDESPGEMARRRMAQLRVAAAAGSDAWRRHDLPAQRSRSGMPAREGTHIP
ncbi:MAG: hypothetical protein ACXV3C_09150 [Actinomycetes bacterium]